MKVCIHTRPVFNICSLQNFRKKWIPEHSKPVEAITKEVKAVWDSRNVVSPSKRHIKRIKCIEISGNFKPGKVSTFLKNRGPRSNLTTSEESSPKIDSYTTPLDSQPMISYRLFSHFKPLGPIISQL